MYRKNRQINRIMSMVLAFSLLLSGILPGIAPMEVKAVEEASQTVLYVDGKGSGTKDGTSAANALATLAEAYAKIPANNTQTTIVICGDVLAYEGASKYGANNSWFPYHTGKVIITSKYGTEDYSTSAVLDFGNYTKIYYFLGDTTFENLKIDDIARVNGTEGRAGAIYANYYSFRLGQGIVCDGDFASTIYLGTCANAIEVAKSAGHPISIKDVEFTMESGSVGYVYGGGDTPVGDGSAGKDYSVTINLNGKSPWGAVYGSGKGTAGQVHHKRVEINVKSGNASKVYAASDNAHIYEGVTVNVTGGKLLRFYANTDNSTIDGGVTVHYKNVSNVDLPRETSGSFAVRLESASVAAYKENKNLWDSVTGIQMTDDSTLTLPTADQVPAQKVPVTVTRAGDSWNTATPLITAPVASADMFEVAVPEGYIFSYDSGVASWTLQEEAPPVKTVLYVDGVNGSDDNDGSSAAKALKTLAVAYNKIPKDNTQTTIVICGDVVAYDGANKYGANNHWFPYHTGKVIITSVYGTEDYRDSAVLDFGNYTKIYYFQGDTTFENLKIDDVGRTNAEGRAGTIYANYYSFQIGAGVDCNGGDFASTIYMGTCANALEVAKSAGTPITIKDVVFTMKSGAASKVYGGGEHPVGDGTEGKNHTVTINIDGQSAYTAIYGSGKGDAGHHKSIEINVKSGNASWIYGAFEGAHIYEGVTVNVTGGKLLRFFANDDVATIDGGVHVQYKNVSNMELPRQTGGSFTVGLESSKVTAYKDNKVLWDSVTGIQMTDDSTLTLPTADQVPAQKVPVTVTRAGDSWNTATPLITAPAASADMFEVAAPEGYCFIYAADVASWTLTKVPEETDEPTEVIPGATVLYVDGVGSGTKDGSSKENALATLAAAYDLIPEDNINTVIVICGTVIPHTGAVKLGTTAGTDYRFQPHAGKVIITSAYGEENYKETAAINFDGKNYYFLGDTTLENLRITGGAQHITANYFPFTLGRGLDCSVNLASILFMGTSTEINGTAGNRVPVDVADTVFTMESGKLRSVYGGGNWFQGEDARGKNNTTTVNIHGGTLVNVFGSGMGGTNNAHHKSVTVNVTGGTVENVYGTDKNATVLNDLNIHVTGGQIGTLCGARNPSRVAGDVIITVNGGTVNKLIAKEEGSTVEGGLVLHYDGADNVTLGSVEGFDTLKLTGSTVTVPAGMEGMWSTVKALQLTDDSVLTMSTKPDAVAQKVSVSVKKAGTEWNVTDALIQAPAGTADMFEVEAPLDHAFAYVENTNGVTWTLRESEISIGQTGTGGSKLQIDLGLPVNADGTIAYSPMGAYATAYEIFQQRLEDLGEAKDEVKVVNPISVQGQIELYVAPDGNDSNKGDKDHPFRTINRALSFIEALQDLDVQGVVVYLRAGTYVTSDTIVLDSKISGRNGVPVIVSAYNNEKVVITGGVDIPGSAFSTVTDEAVKNRLQTAVRDKIIAVDLKAQGISEFGSISYGDLGGPNYQIFINGTELTPARYPNATKLWVGEILDQGPIISTTPHTNTESTGVEFKMQDFRPKTWVNDGNIWLKGSMYAEWDIKNIRVAEIRESSIKLDGGAEYGARSLTSNTYYYYNILEELDVPGEYYLDATNGILYLYPVGNMENATVTYSAMAEDLIRLEGTENVVLNGLTVMNGAGNGICMSNCVQTVIQNCEITKVGTGVYMLENQKCGVIYSEVYETANRPIEVLRGQTYFDFTPSDNFVQNCYIYNTGTKNPKFCAIYVAGTRNIVSHNLVQGTFSVAIYLQYAKECIVEYNEIVGSPNGTHDGGAFYMPSDDIAGTGNHIRYNYIHDIGRFSRSHDPWSIYFDEGLSECYAYGNIMANVPGGFFANGGSANVVVNNVIVNEEARSGSKWAIHTGNNLASYTVIQKSRGRALARYEQFQALSAEQQQEVRGRNPIMGATIDRIGEAVNSAEGTATKGVFAARDNYVANNLIVNHGSIDMIGINGGGTQLNNVVLNEIPFADMRDHDFNLKSSVDTGSWGFTYTIPSMDKIGVVTESKAPIGAFEVCIPAAGETGVSPVELLLRWSNAGGADTYLLEVAADAGMTQIIHRETLEGTQRWFVEDDRFAFGETYYWQVTACGTAESRNVTPVSTEIASFTIITWEDYLTTNVVDLTALNATIADAKASLAEIKEVSEGGVYFAGTKADLQAAITAAEAVVARGNAQTQADVNVANYDLEYVLSVTNTKREIQYVTFDRLDVSDWALPNGLNGSIAAVDGELQMAYASSYLGRTEYMYVNELDTREMLCFQMKMDTLDSWNGFALAQTNTDVFITEVAATSGYFICFKADQIELQKRHNGISYGNIAVTQNNREIMEAGEWMDIQIGAVNNADGSVRIFFQVNDTVVFDYLDDSGPIYGCGNFGIVVQEVSTSSIHLKQKESATSASIGRMGSTLNYEDIISVVDIFELKDIDLDSVDLMKDAGILVWSVEEFETLEDIGYDETHAKPGLKPLKNTSYYCGVSEGIITRDLHKDAYYVGYVKLADGTYIYSEPKLYGPSVYAYSMLGKESTRKETRDLCVALLNYISAAQSFFYPGTAETDLVNYELDEEQKSIAWTQIEFTLAPEIAEDKIVKIDEEVFERTGKNLLFEEKISLVSLYVIDKASVDSARECGTIFWTAEQFAALQGIPSKDNFGEGTKISGLDAYLNADQWYACAPAVAAKDMSDTQYYVLGYLVDAADEIHYSGLMSYSFEQYIKNMVEKSSTSESMRNFAQRLYFYERAAKAALSQ